MGLKKSPQGSQSNLCQLLKVLNSFPSAAAGAAEIHGSAPEISPLAARRGIDSRLLSSSSTTGPTPHRRAEPGAPHLLPGRC